MDKIPWLSIIITSYSMKRLGDVFELLDSIQAQTYPNIETIFVAERFPELYEQIKAHIREKAIPDTKVVFNDGELGMSAARNLGIRYAQGDIIAFIDDDALPFPDWAEEMVRTYEGDSVMAVTGPALPLWEDESMAWLPDEFYWLIGCTAWCDWDEQREVRNIWGMNMSFRREAFDIAGTFSTSIGAIQGRRLHGEEDELSLRIKRRTKGRVIFNPRIRVNHRVYKHRSTPRFVARSSYWIGYTRCLIKKLYPDGDEGKDVLSVEHQLLKRILVRLLPAILRSFCQHPRTAWRQLSLTVNSLFFIALGYLSCRLHKLDTHKMP